MHSKSQNDIDLEGKVLISYKVIFAFFSAIILSTLGLGLLLALVNPPPCFDNEKLIQKRDVGYFETSSSLNILKNLLNNRNSVRKELDRCGELDNPTNGTLWENLRLPSNVIPINYEVVLYTPIFAAEQYSGEITIKIKVLEATNYILLNAKYLSVYLPSLKTINGNPVELSCEGLYLPNDYYVLKTVKTLVPNEYILDLYYTGYLNVFNSGIFEIKYNNDDNEFDGSMLATHFEPLDARKAYPCFDEPQLKATYTFRIYHPKGTRALANMPFILEEEIDGEILSTFNPTPLMPSYLIGLTVFNKTDFDYKISITQGNTPIRLWARKSFIDSGLADDPMKMIVKIFNSLEKVFKAEFGRAIPPKIDVFAIPYYPQEAVPHLGLAIFEENKILFKDKTVMERTKQSIALLIAKQFSEFWFGNYVTFSWWSDLWLQESISDYLKYKIVNDAYPDWKVYDQFITEELINVLVEDSYPSSHPVIKYVNSPTEIDELFDDVETSKGAAILRMIEYEIGSYDFMLGLKNYLNQSKNGIGHENDLWNGLENIRNWSAKTFGYRWLLQSNYPLVRVRINKSLQDGKFYVNIKQERFKSEYSIFSGQDYYPSPYGFVWYIPLKCTFGRFIKDPEPLDLTFDLETKEINQIIGNGTTEYIWVHCDQTFAGYYLMDYSVENWENLGLVLKNKNQYLEAVDRANIIHNLFMNSFAGKTSYAQLTDVLSYLRVETDYLPWKTVHKHVSDLANILEYRRSFYQFSRYFVTMLEELENKENLWEPSGDHVEELKREILLELSCRLQDSVCLNNATSLWPIVFNSILDQSNINNLPPHVKSVVYNYHIQNTYVANEWRVIFAEYENLPDIQEREMVLEAITYSRLPWLLNLFLEPLLDDIFKRNDFFDAIQMLSKNELGRELCWDYYRSNFEKLNTIFGFENLSIGKALIDIVSSFSDEFLFFELLTFIQNTQDGASRNARLRAMEIVSTNVNWITETEDDIIDAFGGDRTRAKQSRKKFNIKQKLIDAYRSLKI